MRDAHSSPKRENAHRLLFVLVSNNFNISRGMNPNAGDQIFSIALLMRAMTSDFGISSVMSNI